MPLPKDLFWGVTEQDDSWLGIYPRQVREVFESFVTDAGWYNERGELLGTGDLSVKDFENIYKGLLDLAEPSPFIIVPSGIKLRAYVDVPPAALARMCDYIIHPQHILAFDARAALFEELFFKQDLPVHFCDRREAFRFLNALGLQ